MSAVIPLPPPSHYPQLYTSARAALFRCDQIDECKEWSNKAAALASYARQSKDETLKDMAQRIQARAVRRVGELLGGIPVYPVKGAMSRKDAANDAGLKRLDRLQASAIASIPAAKFDELVEGSNPPKVYQLAAIGTKRRARPRGATRLSMLRQNLAKAEEKAQVLTNKLAAALAAVRVARAALEAYGL